MPSRRILRHSERNASPVVRENKLSTPVPSPVKKEKPKPAPEEEWVEPSLQSLPSYVQQGLDKNYLFEFMQPLGAPPPPALLAKLKLKVNTGAGKKSTSGKKNQTSATPEVMTPTEQSTPARNGISVQRLIGNGVGIDMEVFNSPQTPDSESYDMEADRSPKQPSTPPKQMAKNGVVTPPNPTQPREPLTRTPQEKNDMDLVVGHCVDELKAVDKDTTGLAVKRIYEDSHFDREKCNLIDAILHNRADADQKRVFAVELKGAKSAIRAERRASKRVAELQHSPIQTAQAKTSPPPHATDMAEPVPSGTDSQPMSRNPSSSSNASASELQTPRTTTLSGIQTRSSRRIAKLTEESVASPSPSPKRKTIVRTIEDSKMNPPSTPIGRQTRSRARRDSGSSDLSSVDEGIVNDGPPANVVTGSKRSAVDAGILEESDEESSRRKKIMSELENSRTRHESHAGKLSDVRSLPKSRSGITLNFNRTTRSRKRPLDDGESRMTSPLPSPNLEGLSAMQSARPSAVPELPKAKRVKIGGARTKISPMKNRTTHAGVPRTKRNASKFSSRQATPSRGNETGGDNDEEMDRNFDHCVACGEGGNLVCCDGCENSFHFRCCDPPMASQAALDEPYYCYACNVSSGEPDVEPSPGGPFDGLFIKLNGTNTASFQLPKDIRTYFDGVKSQANGEYLDTTEPRFVPNSAKTRSGNTTLDDQVDAKPSYPTCYSCGETSYPNRTIIQCDIQGCSANWHLDCLDPPRSNPPAQTGKARQFFRCPLHVENDIKLISNPMMGAETQQRIHRMRQVKHPYFVHPTIERGNRNNGFIEVEGVDEELSQPDGIVYALGAKTVILDFITRAKRQRNENSFVSFQQRLDDALASVNPDNMTDRLQSLISAEVERQVNKRMEEVQDTQADFAARPRAEQDMAMFLTNFAIGEQETASVDADNIATLSRAATATDPVGTASTLDIVELKKLQDVISEAIALKEGSVALLSSITQNEPSKDETALKLGNHDEAIKSETDETTYYNHAQEATLKLFNATNASASDSPDATGATMVDSPGTLYAQATVANGPVVDDSTSATGAEAENLSGTVSALAAPAKSEETIASLSSKDLSNDNYSSLAAVETMSAKEETAEIQDMAELDADDGGATSTASQSSPPSIMDISQHEKSLKIDPELALPSPQPVKPVSWADSPPMTDGYEGQGADSS